MTEGNIAPSDGGVNTTIVTGTGSAARAGAPAMTKPAHAMMAANIFKVPSPGSRPAARSTLLLTFRGPWC